MIPLRRWTGCARPNQRVGKRHPLRDHVNLLRIEHLIVALEQLRDARSIQFQFELAKADRAVYDFAVALLACPSYRPSKPSGGMALVSAIISMVLFSCQWRASSNCTPAGADPSGAGKAAVNVRCLEGVELSRLTRIPVDGRSF
jgi:hypothetical protein